MNKRWSAQRGAFLVLMLLFVILIIGTAALALDVGRVLVLRSEMQNAVDAAALAAAAQLDGAANARQRAKNAARNALVYNSHFGKVKELLGDVTLPDSAFTFFCIIGSRFDPDASDAEVDLSNFCGNTTPFGTGADSNKYEAVGDNDSHYVRVRLVPTDDNAEHFTVPLIFLPVLRLLGGDDDIPGQVTLAAYALAGRNFFACDFPPMAICDPFEGSGGFRANMPLGGHIILKQQTPGWSPGNAGFLRLTSSGAKGGSHDLADERETGCSPPILTPEPGGMTQLMQSAINTRFGIYKQKTGNTPDDIYGSQFSSIEYRVADADDWPAAPNVVNYPLDQTTQSDDRFGNGDWLCSEYWATHHDLLTEFPPVGCLSNTLMRWEVYNHEINNTLPFIMEDDDTSDDLPPVGPERAQDKDSSAAAQFADRRRFFVGVVSCTALGIQGANPFPVFSPDGFAEIFIIQPATEPPNAQIIGEYIGWGDEDDGNFHVDIQLYE